MHLSLMISRRYINRLKLSLMHISLLAGIPEEFKVNIYIGWLFKLIPLIMGLICIALGGFVLESSGQSEYFVAGHVLISLAAICLALFTTAFIIISQLTRGVNTFYNTLFPIIGYAGSIITMIWGWALLAGNDVMADEFVAGSCYFRRWYDCRLCIDGGSVIRSLSAHSQKCSGEQERWNAGTGLFFINR